MLLKIQNLKTANYRNSFYHIILSASASVPLVNTKKLKNIVLDADFTDSLSRRHGFIIE